MERTLKWYMPESETGSFFLAILAHATIYGGILLVLAMGALQRASAPVPQAEEVAYETFSEPPAPAEEAKPVASTPEPDQPEEKADEPDNTPKEMQDQSSTVAGTQATAPKQAATTGAQGAGSAEATPYYKIKPKYPRAALVAGTEGWVLMKIDVNEQGEVENVRVIGGEQRNLFQDEARRAVEKWKYKPFVDASGKPVRKTDHEVRVDFKLQDAA